MSHPLLELKTRRRLHQAIKQMPGIRPTHLVKLSDFSSGTVLYHVDRLIDEGLVKLWERGPRMKHLFDAKVAPADYHAISAMRQHLSEDIIKRLNEAGEAQIYELAEDLNESRKVIMRHLVPLQEAGLVERVDAVERRPLFRPSGLARRLGRRTTGRAPENDQQ